MRRRSHPRSSAERHGAGHIIRVGNEHAEARNQFCDLGRLQRRALSEQQGWHPGLRNRLVGYDDLATAQHPDTHRFLPK